MTTIGIDTLLLGSSELNDYFIYGFLNQLVKSNAELVFIILIPKKQEKRWTSTDKIKFVPIDPEVKIFKKEITRYRKDPAISLWLCLNGQVRFDGRKSILFLDQLPVIKPPVVKHIIATSVQLKRQLVQKFHLEASRISVIYPGVNPLSANPEPNQITVVSGGSANELINVVDIVATSALKHRTRHFNLLVNEARVLTTRAKVDARRVGNISVLPNRPDQLESTLSYTQFVIADHLKPDTLPLALIVLSFGIPTLCDKNSFNLEIFEDGALYCNTADTVEMVDQISHTIKQTGLRQILSEKAAEQKKRFTWDGCVDAVINLIRNQISND
ncbi:MAG: hypothetical protein WC773_03385 [Patescibacteria group bacterium]|jgi:glycosyltransferase involved in cell wall biosynthesis